MITTQNLQKIEERLYSELPIIGGGLRRRAAQALAQDGSPGAVRSLAKAITRSNDTQVRAISLDALRQIKKQQCIDEVCTVWAVTRHKDLTNLFVKKGWLASAPVNIKVLSALKAGQLKVVTEGRAEIVEPLLKAFSDADNEIASRASQCAISLKNLEAQEFLCRLVIEQDHQIARQITVNAQYAPRDSNQRALFLFLTEQWERYESLDFEQTLLQTAYLVGNEQLRQRIAQKVRQAGRAEWVKVLAGGRQKKRLGEMTNAEWETTLAVLTHKKQWEEMWRLAESASPIWSARILQQLKKAGVAPKTEFAEVMRLGQNCIVDLPNKLSKLLYCRAILRGHSSSIRCSVISSNGRVLATGSTDNTVRLWSLPDGKLLQILKGHTNTVNNLAITPDGQLLASGSSDETIKLWSLPEGKLLQTLTLNTRIGKNGSRPLELIYCLSFSPNGRLLISSANEKVILWSLPEGKLLKTLKGHDSCVYNLAITPNGKLLASGCLDHIQLWSLPDGKPLQTLAGQTFAMSPDGTLLSSASYADNTVQLWSLPDGKLLQTLTKHTEYVQRLVISPDGKLLTSESNDDNTVRLWSLPDGKLLQTLTGHTERINCLAISPDGKLLTSGSSYDNTLLLWSLPDGKLLQTLTGHTKLGDCLGISLDGKLLASVDDNTVRLWSSASYYLSRLPVEQMNTEHIQWVQKIVQNEVISEAERALLQFLLALTHWRRRFDVEVEEASQKIDAGEFDIEIEG